MMSSAAPIAAKPEARPAAGWLRPTAFLALLYGAYVAARLALHQGDASLFVVAGDVFADPSRVPANLHVLAHSFGFDGQFAYRLALDPFTNQKTAFGISFDNGPYRSQRILYPLLGWLLSLGRPALVPGALILVNFVGLCAIGALGALNARGAGRSPWWGLLPALYPGVAITLSDDLTEITELALLMLGLVLLRRERFRWAAAALSLAVLGRETALVLPLAIAATWLVGRLWARPRLPWYVFAAPLATYVAWQGVLWARWGVAPLRAGGGNLVLPFSGIVEVFRHPYLWAHAVDGIWYLEVGVLCCFGALVLWALPRTKAAGYERLAWLLYLALAVSLSGETWHEGWSFLRALTEWYALGSLIVIWSPRRPRLPLLAPVFALWLFLVLLML